MKLFRYISILILLLVNLSLTHQSANTLAEPELNYLVRLPKIKIENPPLLLLLHGVGSNEQDLFSFAQDLPGKYLVISVRAPYILGEGSYAWYEVNFVNGKPQINAEQEKNSRNVLVKFLEDLKSKHQFDEKQVFLCGFSQGGIMSYSLALTRPDIIKGIAVMSGRLLDEVKPSIKQSKELQNLQVHISHGTEDNVLGVHYAREAEAYLKTLGLTPQFKEYKGGHTITGEMFKDLNLWLSK